MSSGLSSIGVHASNIISSRGYLHKFRSAKLRKAHWCGDVRFTSRGNQKFKDKKTDWIQIKQAIQQNLNNFNQMTKAMNLATRLDSFQHADAVDHPSSHRPLKFQCHWNTSKINRNLLAFTTSCNSKAFSLYIICPRSEYCQSWKRAWVLALEHGKANHYTSKLGNQKKLFEML